MGLVLFYYIFIKFSLVKIPMYRLYVQKIYLKTNTVFVVSLEFYLLKKKIRNLETPKTLNKYFGCLLGWVFLVWGNFKLIFLTFLSLKKLW
jgi:hypothetical protein